MPGITDSRRLITPIIYLERPTEYGYTCLDMGMIRMLGSRYETPIRNHVRVHWLASADACCCLRDTSCMPTQESDFAHSSSWEWVVDFELGSPGEEQLCLESSTHAESLRGLQSRAPQQRLQIKTYQFQTSTREGRGLRVLIPSVANLPFEICKFQPHSTLNPSSRGLISSSGSVAVPCVPVDSA